MRIEKTTVTPQIARKLLEGNDSNRRLQPSRVLTFAATMRAGQWQLNGETVIVGESGRLLDGQHRLAAVVEYGRGVPMVIAYDVPEGAFTTIDTGRTRTAGDILGIAHVSHGNIIAGAAGILWRMFHNARTNAAVPPPYIVQIVERYPALQDWAARAQLSAKIAPPSPMLAALVYLDTIADRPGLAGYLYERLVSGEDLAAGSPVLALRNRLMSMRASGVTMNITSCWPMLCRAISALEAGETLKRLQAPRATAAMDRPELFEEHAGRLTPAERLSDLLAPTSPQRKRLRVVEQVAA